MLLVTPLPAQLPLLRPVIRKLLMVDALEVVSRSLLVRSSTPLPVIDKAPIVLVVGVAGWKMDAFAALPMVKVWPLVSNEPTVKVPAERLMTLPALFQSFRVPPTASD